jgi:hypothetical protein
MRGALERGDCYERFIRLLVEYCTLEGIFLSPMLCLKMTAFIFRPRPAEPAEMRLSGRQKLNTHQKFCQILCHARIWY